MKKEFHTFCYLPNIIIQGISYINCTGQNQTKNSTLRKNLAAKQRPHHFQYHYDYERDINKKEKHAEVKNT